jgi:hypothetical protein
VGRSYNADHTASRSAQRSQAASSQAGLDNTRNLLLLLLLLHHKNESRKKSEKLNAHIALTLYIVMAKIYFRV